MLQFVSGTVVKEKMKGIMRDWIPIVVHKLEKVLALHLSNVLLSIPERDSSFAIMVEGVITVISIESSPSLRSCRHQNHVKQSETINNITTTKSNKE